MKSVEAAGPMPVVLDSPAERSKAQLDDGAQLPNSLVNDEIIALVEKVFPRLPAEGAVIVIGSLTTDATPSFADGFARGLGLIAAKPVLSVHFGSHSRGDEPSLAEILRGTSTLDEIIPPENRTTVKTIAAGLFDRDSSAILVSPAFREFLRGTRKQFPWIIIYCPSLLNGEETTSLISRAHAVIATMHPGEGRGGDVQALRKLCAQLKTEFLGVVLA